MKFSFLSVLIKKESCLFSARLFILKSNYGRIKTTVINNDNHRFLKSVTFIPNLCFYSVQGYVESRAVEVIALSEFVKNTTNHRPFQKLPNHMRRRAMSHNIKRVPKRLQDQLKDEVSVRIKFALFPGKHFPEMGLIPFHISNFHGM